MLKNEEKRKIFAKKFAKHPKKWAYLYLILKRNYIFLTKTWVKICICQKFFVPLSSDLGICLNSINSKKLQL